jgi:uncharacterized protein YndB with AHSA1/START domain
MTTVQTERTIAAPIEQVFDLLTDHANYKQFPGLTGSELVKEGEPEPNGTGALRKVSAGPIRFEEEITAFERPARMDYLIRKVNMPLDHEGGTMLFESRDGATHVTWRSTFEFTTPGVGRLMGGVGAPAIRAGFARILKYADRNLAG